MPKLKIAIIGAGSVGFTRKLFSDIVAVPELRDAEFALTDISAAQPRHGPSRSSSGWSRSTGCRPRSPPRPTGAPPWKARATSSTASRIGGLEAFADDIDIPLKYGVDQCVGDTLCAGGIMYGQRNIPVILDFCKDIREVAEPARSSSTTPTRWR